ncbi:MAG: hypothetical protein ACREI3_07930 [Nitrospirales bacterium]
MTTSHRRQALFYPFHLCHERTLMSLLKGYDAVHFRDYMALQLSPFSGTTAFPDRMGDTYPDLLDQKRIVQGHSVSGPLDPAMRQAIDQDMADDTWRALFHAGLRDDRRFQRGLFDWSHGMSIGGRTLPGPAVFLQLSNPLLAARPYRVEDLCKQSRRRVAPEEGVIVEYGIALLKTAAALRYTVRLCRRHDLEAATDSPFHFALLERTCQREGLVLSNRLVPREGY